MNIKVAREIVKGLRRDIDDLLIEAVKIALEQLELALEKEPPQTLQISVSDELDFTGNMG